MPIRSSGLPYGEDAFREKGRRFSRLEVSSYGVCRNLLIPISTVDFGFPFRGEPNLTDRENGCILVRPCAALVGMTRTHHTNFLPVTENSTRRKICGIRPKLREFSTHVRARDSYRPETRRPRSNDFSPPRPVTNGLGLWLTESRRLLGHRKTCLVS